MSLVKNYKVNARVMVVRRVTLSIILLQINSASFGNRVDGIVLTLWGQDYQSYAIRCC